jgi:type I restriction enzyme R subunit
MHDAMEGLLPGAMFIGFTGTPLLKADKKTTFEKFCTLIHTHKFDEAVDDGIVLDLSYEARDIDQHLTSPAQVDKWFDIKTRGMTDLSRAALKRRWGTMQKVVSSEPRANSHSACICSASPALSARLCPLPERPRSCSMVSAAAR